MKDSIGDVVCGDLTLKQVAAHVDLGCDAACLGPLLDHRIGHEARSDPIGIDGVDRNPVRGMFQCILAHQRHQGRLGGAIGAKVRPRVDRLFADIENNRTTGLLLAHHVHRCAGDIVMAPEIQVEGGLESAVRNIEQGALESRSGIGDQNIDPAIGLGYLCDRVNGRFLIRQVAGNRKRAETPRLALGTVRIDIDQGNFRALCPERFRDRKPEAAGSASDNRDLACQGLLDLLGQLYLLQRPIFDIEQVFFGKRLEPVDPLGASDDLDGGFGNVGDICAAFCVGPAANRPIPSM